MRYIVVTIVLLSVVVRAQDFAVRSYASPATPLAPPAATLPPPATPLPPRFWTVENKVGASIFAALLAADGITTQRGLNEGLREMNPVLRPLVTRGAPGEAVGSALGFGAGIGLVYLLHRRHHYLAERITMRLMVADEAGFVVNNIVAIR